jgi:hypothetical protein
MADPSGPEARRDPAFSAVTTSEMLPPPPNVIDALDDLIGKDAIDATLAEAQRHVMRLVQAHGPTCICFDCETSRTLAELRRSRHDLCPFCKQKVIEVSRAHIECDLGNGVTWRHTILCHVACLQSAVRATRGTAGLEPSVAGTAIPSGLINDLRMELADASSKLCSSHLRHQVSAHIDAALELTDRFDQALHPLADAVLRLIGKEVK